MSHNSPVNAASRGANQRRTAAITENLMNTQSVTIQGQQFTIPAPFLEGHVCKPNEAGALNQLFAENIRNNFAQKMKSAKDAGQAVPGQSELDAYAASYSFGVRAVKSKISDPVEREARALVWAALKARLVANGTKLKTLTEDAIEDLIVKALEKHPKFREQARAVVAARQAVTGDLADL